MPCVSQFFGISIYFYFEDHQPPHFHAFYVEHEAVIEIDSLTVSRGGLPPRVYALVVEWGMKHRPELNRAWRQASLPGPVDPIAPLE